MFNSTFYSHVFIPYTVTSQEKERCKSGTLRYIPLGVPRSKHLSRPEQDSTNPQDIFYKSMEVRLAVKTTTGATDM